MDSHASGSLVIWHIDEMFVKAMNTEWYLWNVVDDNSRCLAIHLSLYRDMQSAVSALLSAKESAKQIPDIVVSDEYNAYPGAIRRAFGWRWKGLHVQAHFKPVIVRHKGYVLSLSNNRIEGFNSWLHERVTLLRGFKNDFYMTKYLEGFRIVWNKTKFFVLSLIGLTEPQRMNFIKIQKIDVSVSTFIFEDIYECIREATQSLMSIDGYKPYSHEALISFLKEFYKFDESDITTFDRYRILRNNCIYRAAKVSPEVCKESLRFLEEFLPKIKKEFDRKYG
jgi:transposase-like protein